jgi:membrane-associated protease RseP (regulator of RpoE activity)
MKIVKFFSFIMLLSLGFVACKENSKAEQTAENTTVALENAMQTAKAEIGKTITELQTTVNTKITEAEKELESASEEAKVEINVKLDGLRKQRTDLENLAKKVGDATAEGWAEVEKEATLIVADIKEALK